LFELKINKLWLDQMIVCAKSLKTVDGANGCFSERLLIQFRSLLFDTRNVELKMTPGNVKEIIFECLITNSSYPNLV
jgi:hypothetical protein